MTLWKFWKQTASIYHDLVCLYYLPCDIVYYVVLFYFMIFCMNGLITIFFNC